MPRGRDTPGLPTGLSGLSTPADGDVLVGGGGRWSAMHTAAGVVALLGSFTASNMRTALGADATGTGPAVFADSPSLTTQATIVRNNIGATTFLPGLQLANNTLSNVGASTQASPYIGLLGRGYNSASGLDETQEFRLFTFPNTQAGPTTATFVIQRVANGGTPANILTVSSTGALQATAGITASSGNIQATAGSFVANGGGAGGVAVSSGSFIANIVSRYRLPPARVTSTGAGAQTIFSMAITTGTARRVRGTIIGVKSDGSASYSYGFTATAISPSGTASVNAVVTADAGSSTTTTAPTITASSGNIVFASGDTAATTIRWTVAFSEETDLTAA